MIWSMTKPRKLGTNQRHRSAWASTQSDHSSLCTLWVAKDPNILEMDSKDWSDWVDTHADLSLSGRLGYFVGFVMLQLM